MPTTVEETEKAKIGEDKKDELLLDSLEIKGYRCFEHLTIEKLGRVNLIVGKNNVGKTALLEALRIYFQQGKISLFKDISYARDESSKFIREDEDFTELLSNFFQNRSLEPHNKITIGKTIQNEERVIIQILPGSEINSEDNQQRLFRDLDALHIVVIIGQDILYSIPLNIVSRRLRFTSEIRNQTSSTNLQFVKASGLDDEDIANLWDKIVLTDLEEFAVESLKLIAPNVQRISFRGEDRRNQRIPIVKTSDSEKPFPLRSLGEGMSRILGITLSLANGKNGALIVDEIESGLHYSVLPDVWKLIFKTAKDLNVQVFATTHSKDCIEAFAQAAVDSPEDGMLIRLERHAEKIVAKTINEEMLADAVNYDVEVR
jgi:AAA15 family ATPase/GTPase